MHRNASTLTCKGKCLKICRRFKVPNGQPIGGSDGLQGKVWQPPANRDGTEPSAKNLALGWILPLALAEKLCYPAPQSDA